MEELTKIKIRLAVLFLLSALVIALVILLIFMLRDSEKILTYSPEKSSSDNENLLNNKPFDEETQESDESSGGQVGDGSDGKEFLPLYPSTDSDFRNFKITPLVIFENLRSTYFFPIIILIVVIMIYFIYEIKALKRKINDRLNRWR